MISKIIIAACDDNDSCLSLDLEEMYESLQNKHHPHPNKAILKTT